MQLLKNTIKYRPAYTFAVLVSNTVQGTGFAFCLCGVNTQDCKKDYYFSVISTVNSNMFLKTFRINSNINRFGIYIYILTTFCDAAENYRIIDFQ